MDTKTKEVNYTQYGKAVDIDEAEEDCVCGLMEGLRHCLERTIKYKEIVPQSYGFAFALEPQKGHLVYLCSLVCRTGLGDIPTLKERLEESGYRSIFIIDDEPLIKVLI